MQHILQKNFPYTSSAGMTGQARRQARQYRQEENATLGMSRPSSSGTIFITL